MRAPRRASARASAAKAPFDVLVVGGGPAGAAAAIYAARKGIRTGIAAERLGGQLLDTVGIENFISVKETEGHELATGLEQHVDDLRRRRDESAARGGADSRRSDRSETRRRRRFEGAVGDHCDRRALARNQRAGRARIPQPRRRLLSALRRSPVQGQARRRDRRRQLRRRGGNRSRRTRRATCTLHRVRRPAARRRGAAPQSCAACPT